MSVLAENHHFRPAYAWPPFFFLPEQWGVSFSHGPWGNIMSSSTRGLNNKSHSQYYRHLTKLDFLTAKTAIWNLVTWPVTSKEKAGNGEVEAATGATKSLLVSRLDGHRPWKIIFGKNYTIDGRELLSRKVHSTAILMQLECQRQSNKAVAV